MRADLLTVRPVKGHEKQRPDLVAGAGCSRIVPTKKRANGSLARLE